MNYKIFSDNNWRNKYLEYFSVFFIITNLLYFSFVYFTNKTYLDVVLREDFIFEWATFAFLLLSGGICFLFSIRLKNHKLYFPLFVVGTLIFLFGAMEEVSWFQRVFDFKGAEIVTRNNSQAEFNLHNLMIGGVSINRVIFGKILGLILGLYYLVPVIAKEFSKTGRSLFEGIYIPTPKLIDLWTFLLTVGIVYLVLNFKKQGEILEYLLSFQLLLLFFREYRKFLRERYL